MFRLRIRLAATILDGRQLSLNIRNKVRDESIELFNKVKRKPGLAIIQVGEDAPSKVYVGHKVKAGIDCGLHVEHLKLPRSSNEANILATIHAINENDDIHGVILQLPVDSAEEVNVDRCIEAIDPKKDVDGLHFKNAGQLARGMMNNGTLLPCTPRGCMELLRAHSPRPLRGMKAVVLGRSKIVGSPIAELLKWEDVTVTTVHSRTPPDQVIALCREADIVVAACRQPQFLKGYMLKPGAMVVDVGINSIPDATKKSGARIVGDVDYDSCKEVAGYITPVPGHVGPMTIAMLLQNTLDAAKRYMVADFTRWDTRPLSLPVVRPAAVDDFALNQMFKPKHITEVSKEMRLFPHEVLQSGPFKAKLDSERILRRLGGEHRGKYVVVSSVTPTRSGEGKTTTVLGLSQAFMAHLRINCLATLREPSLGPTFSLKGGGTGGGLSQVIPSEDMNLHFNGDIHAVSATQNLLAAATDNCIARENFPQPIEILFGRLTRTGTFTKAQLERLQKLGITKTNPSEFTAEEMKKFATRGLVRDKMTIRRVLDVNDAFIENQFNCTASSEVMNILALAHDYNDLVERLKHIVVGRSPQGFVTARDICVDGALAILMKQASQPNLIQNLEGGPVMVHAGPFAGLGPGVSSVMADTLGLRMVGEDGFVVTEAGFGSDLGLEKFVNIKTRVDDILIPDVCIVVVTTKSLMTTARSVGSHATKSEALRHGAEVNLRKHIGIVKQFNIPMVVAVNTFDSDSLEELESIRQLALEFGADDAVICRHFQEGGRGAVELAESVQKLSQRKYKLNRSYELHDSIEDKLHSVATKVYGREGISLTDAAKDSLRLFEADYKHLPVCCNMSPFGFHAPKITETLLIRDLHLQAGSGLIIADCGPDNYNYMPALPSRPRFTDIGIDNEGNTFGL
eukprot:GEMP01001566.1.p1 GENE.GEMP01001566.1~~GEMP01001566.1.p1  ORF type:complete len:911 (-),score=177.59 GEMP01001566.1:2509-5241(-)